MAYSKQDLIVWLADYVKLHGRYPSLNMKGDWLESDTSHLPSYRTYIRRWGSYVTIKHQVNILLESGTEFKWTVKGTIKCPNDTDVKLKIAKKLQSMPLKDLIKLIESK